MTMMVRLVLDPAVLDTPFATTCGMIQQRSEPAEQDQRLNTHVFVQAETFSVTLQTPTATTAIGMPSGTMRLKMSPVLSPRPFFY